MPVPFSVIRMTLSKKLIAFLSSDNQNFFKKYQSDNTSFKLYKAGFYANLFNENFGIFLNRDYFYEGSFLKD